MTTLGNLLLPAYLLQPFYKLLFYQLSLETTSLLAPICLPSTDKESLSRVVSNPVIKPTFGDVNVVSSLDSASHSEVMHLPATNE